MAQVQGEAQGSGEALKSYLKELNDGPSAAHVMEVEGKSIEIKADESSFTVR